MRYLGALWKSRIAQAINKVYEQSISDDTIVLNKTPDLSKGDFAFPMFPYAKLCMASPADIAKLVKTELDREFSSSGNRIENMGPYVNVFMDRKEATAYMISQVEKDREHFAKSNMYQGKRIMIEFSAPNTNKPLHLGHLRNDALGEGLSRIFRYMGAEVCKINLINDRGIHICKSMLAYQKFSNGETPESSGIKSDHFVGKYYVKYAQWEKEWIEEHGDNADNPESPMAQAQDMLVKWEHDDAETIALWKKMNDWAISGMKRTYQSTHISFDKIDFESKTYKLGKQNVLKGMEDGIFYKDESGAIWIDLEEVNLDKKVLLRGDGTSVYITQDIGTAISRYEQWPFDQIIYVVAHEQNYHFQVLFHVLSKLQFKPAQEQAMYHLGYGMVHLPDGKMKSREGTVVDADNLIQDIANLVQGEIKARGRDEELENIAQVSHDISLGAIHYYLLSVNPKKDVTFNPETSIQFQGNTGPYLQYTCARISSMLDKFACPSGEPRWNETTSDEEWKLILLMDQFSTSVVQAAEKHDPSYIASFLFEIASAFSSFYQNMPIATAEDDGVKIARIRISRAVLEVMKIGMDLLNIPYIKKM